MKNSIIKICLSLIVLISIVSLSYYLFLKYDDDNFSCGTKFILHTDNDILDVDVHYRFKNGHGEVDSIGYLQPEGEAQKIVRINLKFEYRRDGDKLVLFSDDNHPYKEDVALLRMSLPDFYLTKNRGMYMFVYPQGQNAYVFSGYTTPYFLCLKD